MWRWSASEISEVDALAQLRAQIDGGRSFGDHRAVLARELQHLFDQTLGPLHAGFELGETLCARARRQLAADVFQLQRERRDRRAQLMRGVLHEAALVGERVAQACEQAVERNDERLDLSRHAFQRKFGDVVCVLQRGLPADVLHRRRHGPRHAPQDQDRERQQDQHRGQCSHCTLGRQPGAKDTALENLDAPAAAAFCFRAVDAPRFAARLDVGKARRVQTRAERRPRCLQQVSVGRVHLRHVTAPFVDALRRLGRRRYQLVVGRQRLAELQHLIVHEVAHHPAVVRVREGGRSGAHQQKQRHQPQQQRPPQRAHRTGRKHVKEALRR